MSNRVVVLCTYPKCIRNGTENIESYVHSITKWRHEKKRKKNYNITEEELNRLYYYLLVSCII